jgi:thiamine monophosphate synthase
MINKEKFFYIDSIQDIDFEYIKKIKANLILRDKKSYNCGDINKLSNICKKKNLNLFISNNYKLLFKLKTKNFYISSKNRKPFGWLKKINSKIRIIGSAHNLSEIIQKKKQGCESIVLSRLFKTNKKGYLGVTKFNLLTRDTKFSYIALGGIKKKNFNKIQIVNAKGIAMMSELKNKPSF